MTVARVLVSPAPIFSREDLIEGSERVREGLKKIAGAELASWQMTNGIEEMIRDLTVYFFFAFSFFVL